MVQENMDISNLETYKKCPPCDSDYPKLVSNKHYTGWVVWFQCCSKVDNFDCVTYQAEKYNLCCLGANQELLLLQLNFLGLVLHTTLTNPMGSTFVWRHCDDPQKLWFEHEDYQDKSASSVFAGQKIIKNKSSSYPQRFPNIPRFYWKFLSINSELWWYHYPSFGWQYED